MEDKDKQVDASVASGGENDDSKKSGSNNNFEAELANLRSEIDKLARNNNSLLAEKKNALEKERSEREKAILIANENSEFKALAESLGAKVKDLEGERQELTSYKSKVDAYEKAFKVEVDAQFSALSPADQKRIKEIYPELADPDLELAKSFEYISRFNRIIKSGDTKGAPGGAGDSKTTLESKLDEYKVKKNVRGMLGLMVNNK